MAFIKNQHGSILIAGALIVLNNICSDAAFSQTHIISHAATQHHVQESQSAIAGARDVYIKYSQPHTPIDELHVLGEVLSNKSAAYYGYASAATCAAFVAAAETHPKVTPPLQRLIEKYGALFEKYDLIDHRRVLQKNSYSNTAFARLLQRLPQQKQDFPSELLLHGRQFILDFYPVMQLQIATFESPDSGNHIKITSYGLSSYPLPPVQDLNFVPISPTEVQIKTKDPHGFIDPHGYIKTKTLRVIKENGKWFMDVDM